MSKIGSVILNKSEIPLIDMCDNELCYGDIIKIDGDDYVLLPITEFAKVPINGKEIIRAYRTSAMWTGDIRFFQGADGKTIDIPLDNSFKNSIKKLR